MDLVGYTKNRNDACLGYKLQKKIKINSMRTQRYKYEWRKNEIVRKYGVETTVFIQK